MKFLFTLIIVSTLVFTSCKKDNDPLTGDGNMELVIDGDSWNASLAVVANKSAENIVTVTGSDSNAKQCQIIILNCNAIGTYNLSDPNIGRWTAGLAQEQTYTTSVGLGTGTVEITELSDTGISGTFHFSAKNTEIEQITITEGNFNAVFTAK